MVSSNGLPDHTIFTYLIRPLMKSSSGARAIAGVLLTLLEQNSDTRMALSTRVYRAVRSAILDGTLRHGDRLPSTRQLAVDLALSRSTAESAYAQLEDEGYLVRQTGSGSFVGTGIATDVRARPGKPMPGVYVHTSVPDLSERGRQIAVMGGCTDARQTRAFSAGMPALDCFPIATWQRLLSRHARHGADAWMMYGDPQGLPALRESIAQYLSLSRGVDCDAGQVIVLTSSQQALTLI